MKDNTEVPTPPGVTRVKLWDPLLRGFHWLLAASITASWLLANFGPSKMTLHFWLGYFTLGLLAFRLVWGLVGPRHARFASFIRGPRAVFDYAAQMFHRRPSYWPGHNPLGALSVVALLGLIAAQAISGLFIDPDDFINVGPLAGSVSSATRKAMQSWHEVGGTLILLFVILHVAVIVFYRLWKREDLVRPMLNGWKLVRRD